MYMFNEEIIRRKALRKQYEIEIVENKSQFICLKNHFYRRN